tara:strand:- start:368 stop:676 length:309 start_codon:yes stop_codon:yes gene_type:complete
MKKRLILLNLLLLCFLSACESARDGFSLKKKDNSDEFLVEKKSPLVLPPVYGKLPTPDDAIKNSEKNEEFKEVISSSKNNSNKNTTDNKSSSLQESILDKIK